MSFLGRWGRTPEVTLALEDSAGVYMLAVTEDRVRTLTSAGITAWELNRILAKERVAEFEQKQEKRKEGRL
jgi:hypothetical protein